MVKLKKQKVRVRKKTADFSPRKSFTLKGVLSFITGAVLLGMVGFGLINLKYMLIDSDRFNIKSIEVKLNDDYTGASLSGFSMNDVSAAGKAVVGSNIFFIDLNTLKDSIEGAHPEFKEVVVRRLLPNKLIVYARLRKSVAQIRSDRYYPVDKEGVLLSDVKNFPDTKLPIITGVGINLAKASMSNLSQFERDKIERALEIINEMSDSEELSKYKIKVVDIIDPGNVTFFLEGINVEIKIGESDFKDRLGMLATVLEQLGPDVDNFKYIDLRFDDPIMGPR